jgi:Lar family restriction alleviation protein
MSKELKKCPFCGSKNVEIIDGYADTGCWVECQVCHAYGGNAELHETAIENWNRRSHE